MCRGQQLADLWVWKLRDEAVVVHVHESSALQAVQLHKSDHAMECIRICSALKIYGAPIFVVAFAVC